MSKENDNPYSSNTSWDDNNSSNNRDAYDNTDNYTSGETYYYHTPNNYGTEQNFSMNTVPRSRKPEFFVSFLGFFLTIFISIAITIALICFLTYNQKNNLADIISSMFRVSFYDAFNETVDDNENFSKFFDENNISINNIVSDDDLNEFINTVIDGTLYSDFNKDFNLDTFNKSYDKWADNVIGKYCDSNLVNDIFTIYGITQTTSEISDGNTKNDDSAKDIITSMIGTSVASQVKSYYENTYGPEYKPETVSGNDIEAIRNLLVSKSHEHSASKFNEYTDEFNDYMDTVKSENIPTLSISVFRYMMYGSAIFAIICCVIMYFIYIQKHRFARNIGIACLLTAFPIGLITTILHAMTQLITDELSTEDLPKDALDVIENTLGGAGTSFLISTCLLIATFVLMMALGHVLKKREPQNI